MKILGHEIEVTYPNPRDEDLYGLSVFEENRIEIHTTNPEKAQSILIHEILEWVNELLELKLKHSQITGLETGLHQAFAENPRILETVKKQVAMRNQENAKPIS